ncbi:MAG: PHP domain-containing protein [Bacteroides sp.]|nr:PHP domain-containing protein [Bacillota bacterium]MCM1393606.1 PHP domain-containing protein [[Eubacterium] siraeum]MCM1455818.1 PHP domain-containing protein [Bacteroides sp.]
MIADLHIHTTASDGKYSPKEAVRWAKNNGIEVMSVTDHDSVDGLNEARAEADILGIKFVDGIEISALADSEVHVLGYNIDYKNPDFAKDLKSVKDMRRARNVEIGRRLANYGVKLDINFEDDGLGRMNIARAMVDGGYVKDISDAFDRYLGLGGKAYCASRRITPKQAVELIVKYGGFASLAHPKRYLLDKRLDKMLSELAPLGLRGLEVNYPSHFDSDKDALRKECKKYNLLPTGGSDFHGEDDRHFAFNLDMRLIATLQIQ